jgi:hypothetical protein
MGSYRSPGIITSSALTSTGASIYPSSVPITHSDGSVDHQESISLRLDVEERPYLSIHRDGVEEDLRTPIGVLGVRAPLRPAVAVGGIEEPPVDVERAILNGKGDDRLRGAVRAAQSPSR